MWVMDISTNNAFRRSNPSYVYCSTVAKIFKPVPILNKVSPFLFSPLSGKTLYVLLGWRTVPGILCNGLVKGEGRHTHLHSYCFFQRSVSTKGGRERSLTQLHSEPCELNLEYEGVYPFINECNRRDLVAHFADVFLSAAARKRFILSQMKHRHEQYHKRLTSPVLP